MKEENQYIRVYDMPNQPAYYNTQEPNYVSQPQAPQDIEEISLIDFLRIIVKRRWIIIACVLLTTITAIASWYATPLYRATTTLQIDPDQQNVLPFQDVGPAGSYMQSKEYLETQFKVLESRTLAERVIRTLNLDKHPALDEEKATKKGVFTNVKQWLKKTIGWPKKSDEPAHPAMTEEERKFLEFVDKFLKKLKVAPIKSTRMVDISFDSPHPEIAADVANTLASQYIQLNFETKYNTTNAASEFLSEQLVDLKTRVAKAEEDLASFSREHNIYMTSDNENVTLRTLADLSATLTDAQVERIRKESVRTVVRESPPGVFPEVLRNNLITDLEKNVSTLRQERARLAAQFNPGWPELTQVTEQLEAAEAQLKHEREQAVQNVETEYRAALQRENMLAKAINTQKVRVDALNQDSIQYNILSRQVETDKNLYEGMLQRMKEADVSVALQSNNIRIVDKAEIPRLPHSPRKLRNFAIGIFMGLFAGTMLAFFVERLDNSINTPEDVDRFISLPSLGVIPENKFLDRAAKGTKQVKMLGEGIFKDEDSSISISPIKHIFAREIVAEAYRDARTSVMFSGSECPPRVLLMTSSVPAEGKTTSSVNMAIALAQTEKRVLLLDADMRKPYIHQILGMKNDAGLSTYLSGNAELEHVIQKSDIPNLYAITSGPTPPNPSELLGSQRMKNVLELLSETYDHVIIDSPPVLAVTDARVLASFADGVILVVKGSTTPRAAILNAKRLLAHGRLIGVLLNSVDMRSSSYSYSGHYNYGKYTSHRKV